MSIESKKTKKNGVIGLVAVLICCVILIAASNPIYEALSAITFLTFDNADQGGGKPDGDVTNITYGSYTPGTYEATVYGFESDVAVVVEVSATEIVSLKVNATGESPVGINAAAAIKAAVLEGQTAEVDAVSGATYTCDAVLEAIKTALVQASTD